MEKSLLKWEKPISQKLFTAHSCHFLHPFGNGYVLLFILGIRAKIRFNKRFIFNGIQILWLWLCVWHRFWNSDKNCHCSRSMQAEDLCTFSCSAFFNLAKSNRRHISEIETSPFCFQMDFIRFIRKCFFSFHLWWICMQSNWNFMLIFHFFWHSPHSVPPKVSLWFHQNLSMGISQKYLFLLRIL